MDRLFSKLGCLIIGLAVCACSGSKTDTSGNETSDQLSKVRLSGVTERDVAQIEEYTATVESDVKNHITSNAALRIEHIMVDVGDPVRKGQLLVSMDAASLRQLRLQVENLRVEFNRMDELYKVGGVSKSEWDNAKLQLDVNETAYTNMKENTRLVSPVNGVVTARNYDDGDMAGAEPILTVETLSPVKIKINVSETYYSQVKNGMKVDVKAEAYGDDAFSGVVTTVYPTVDASTHTFPVEITLHNADQRLRPGMFVRATLSFGTRHHTVVPDQAVVKQTGSGDYYVYEYDQNTRKVKYRQVQIGRRLGTEYEILEGLAAGVQVVVAGQNRLADGVAVEVIK